MQTIPQPTPNVKPPIFTGPAKFNFDTQTVSVTSTHVWPVLAPGDKVLYKRTHRSGACFYAKAVLTRKPADLQRKATIKVRGTDADGNEVWATKVVETYTLFRGNWVIDPRKGQTVEVLR